MAYYVVRARPRHDRLTELYVCLETGAFERVDGVGTALSSSLLDARFEPSTKEAVWEVEDYCDPPLARERNVILDRYFTRFRFERVHPSMGWIEIDDFPLLWTKITNRDEKDIQVGQIDHVELIVPDQDEAARWYNGVLGLEICREYRRWVDEDDPLTRSICQRSDGLIRQRGGCD
jgi:hypothetical protein